MSLPWLVKYRPKTISDVVNQKEGIRELRQYITSYQTQKKRAILVYGPPGTGKTSSVHALAADLQLEVIEVNASDFRNAERIGATVGAASRQRSLFAKGKVILVDEVDGLSGNDDRGGIQALIALLAKSAYPLVLTAHDAYEQKLSKLRSQCQLVEFAHLSSTDIFEHLSSICRKEHVQSDGLALKSLARRAGGDLRAAINDLQSVAGGRTKIDKDDLATLSDREQTQTLGEALLKIFKTTDSGIALSALDNVHEDIDQVMLWIDENLPKEYTKPEDLARAYEALSRAAVFQGRIRRQQHWRFLSYMNTLLTAGIATAKDEKYKEHIPYTQTKRLLKIWMANQRYAKRKAIAEKVAEKTHTSVKAALRDTVPFLSPIYRNRQMSDGISDFLELSNDEVAWLRR
jgi:replication factor C large subunit